MKQPETYIFRLGPFFGWKAFIPGINIIYDFFCIRDRFCQKIPAEELSVHVIGHCKGEADLIVDIRAESIGKLELNK